MKLHVLWLVLVFSCLGYAQQASVLKDPNEIVKETQRIISIEKGQKIDTAYFKTLFIPSATFTVVGQEDGQYAYETMTLNDFLVLLTDDYYSNGYFEQGTGQVLEEYNGMAQIIQSFEGMDSEGEAGKGVNSYQLVYAEGRWWIANLVWAMSYDNGKDIPKRYLSKKQ
jgi:hypothetical protein